jgi:DNA-binding MarR family transcriptional regulator
VGADIDMYVHITCLPGTDRPGTISSMRRRAVRVAGRRDPGPLSPCVCSSLRMVSRAVTQLYDDLLRPSGLRVTQFSILAAIARLRESNLKQLEETLAIDQTTLTRSLGLLERDGVIEQAPHPDGRIKAMRLTSEGQRALEVARPLWARAQDTVLRELGTKAWPDAKRRLAQLLRIAVDKRSTRSARRGRSHGR